MPGRVRIDLFDNAIRTGLEIGLDLILHGLEVLFGTLNLGVNTVEKEAVHSRPLNVMPMATRQPPALRPA